MYAAAWDNRADSIEFLAAKGVLADGSQSDMTPLIAAASRGNDAAVRALIAHGASLSRTASCGSALDAARANRHDSTVAVLEAARAKPAR